MPARSTPTRKTRITGIVRHLDDQCFGCQYCTLACPYDAPKFHAGKGIVRKCDMCRDRLAAGEAPACVQACPHEAIASGSWTAPRSSRGPRRELPARERRSAIHPADDLLPDEPPDGAGDVAPADDHHVEPEHAHWPLITMLVLTQLSVGGFACELAAAPAGATEGLAHRAATASSVSASGGSAWRRASSTWAGRSTPTAR